MQVKRHLEKIAQALATQRYNKNVENIEIYS